MGISADALQYKWSPYPNFKTQYSIVWDDCFKKLGIEWIDAAIDFYSDCVEYFTGDCSDYHDAYPCDTELKTLRRDSDLLSFISDKKKYPDNESISKAYETEFHGDIRDFQSRR